MPGWRIELDNWYREQEEDYLASRPEKPVEQQLQEQLKELLNVGR